MTVEKTTQYNTSLTATYCSDIGLTYKETHGTKKESLHAH